MRISDWSSDVCSSDLVVDAPREGAVDEAIEHAVEPPAVGGQERGIAAHLDEALIGNATEGCPGQRLAGAREVGGQQQIGRATLQARVGLYVYITGVAVALKKISAATDTYHTST